jgi:hypothetical protein
MTSFDVVGSRRPNPPRVRDQSRYCFFDVFFVDFTRPWFLWGIAAATSGSMAPFASGKIGATLCFRAER